MPGREEMLSKIRAALRRGNDAGPGVRDGVPDLPPPRLMGVMPAVAPAELLDKFEQEVTKVSGVPHRTSSLEDLDEVLRGVLESAGGGSVVLSRNPLLAQLRLGQRLRARGIAADEWRAAGEPPQEARQAYREACFAAAVGITGADWALAETGSLVVTSASEGSQLSSLAPPVHVALYRRANLVESLDDVLERLPLATNAADAGRSVVFVTGVSRTADIEQILIRGVHGPRELHAVLVEESCLGQSAPASR